MKTRLTRRSILKGAGGLALTLPLLPSLSARAEGVFPRRFLVYYHPNGVLTSNWFPTAGASPSDFTLSPSLAPLEPFKHKLLVTRGIDLKCGAIGPGEPHQKGMGGLLTGWHLGEGTMVGGDGSLAGWAKGISLDQRLAKEIGTSTRLGSLLLGVRPRGGDVRHHLSYAGDAQPLPVIADPKVAFGQLFSDFGYTDPELEKIRARRASVLDAVRGQLAQVNGQLPASERQALERHLALVRDLERRLAAAKNGEACALPDEPPALQPDSAATTQEITRLHMDLMAMAFACDLTRVGTLQIGQADNHLTMPWLESNYDGHALSHLGNTDPQKAQVGARDRWYAEQLAYLLGKLDAIPEGDGTMLDHTLVLWSSEISVGNSHAQTSMPIVMAGGGAGFRMGRYLEYQGASHSDLLLSILHGFGVHDATFGNPTYQTGELSGLV